MGTVLAAAITALVGCGGKVVFGEAPGSGMGNVSGDTGEGGAGGAPVVVVGTGGNTGGTAGGNTGGTAGGNTGGAGGEAPAPEVSGACIVRDAYTNMPSFSDPDVGPGYAKQAIPGVNDIDGLKAACTSAIYEHLLGLQCAASGTDAQAEVVTYSTVGTPDTTTCGTIGCEFLSCP
ncbi:MAG: hypothetical protein QM820_03565 [Minicystis sp.]